MVCGSSTVNGSVPIMGITLDWQTYLTCQSHTCAPAGSDLFVVDGTGAANTLTPYTFAPGATNTTGYYRVGNKEWEYCSNRGRCNQETGACRVDSW